MSRRFSYMLEPVRLQRDWQVTDLRVQLAQQNALLAVQQQAVLALDREGEQVREAWRALAASADALHVDRLRAYSAYLARLQVQADAGRARLADIERVRERLLGELAQATRALDAVERHKRDARRGFEAEQAKAEAKDADDHWSILGIRSTHVNQA